MQGKVTLFIFIYFSVPVGSYISRSLCQNRSQKFTSIVPVNKFDETSDSILNTIEQFSVIDEYVIDTIKQHLNFNESFSTLELLKLGVSGEYHAVYFIAFIIAAYWILYVTFLFTKHRKKFTKNVTEYCGFYSKSILIMCCVICMLCSLYFSLKLLFTIRNYENSYERVDENMDALFQNYRDESTHFTSASEINCLFEETNSYSDEIADVYGRIEKYYLEEIPSANIARDIVSTTLFYFRQECNKTTSSCGFGEEHMKIKNFDNIRTLQETIIVPAVAELVGDWSKIYEEITMNKEFKPMFNNSELAHTNRRTKDQLQEIIENYRKVYRVIKPPSLLIFSAPFFLLLVASLLVVVVSFLLIAATLRGHEYLYKLEIMPSLNSFLENFKFISMSTTFLSIFYCWLIFVVGGATYIIFINAFGDSELELFNFLNIETTNETNDLKLRDLLKSTNSSNLENFLMLNVTRRFSPKVDVPISLLSDKKLYNYSAIEYFCHIMENLIQNNYGEWMKAENKKQAFSRAMKLCHDTQIDCFFCSFKEELLEAVKMFEKRRADVYHSFIRKTKGNFVQYIRFFHENFRILLWNSLIAPIVSLETSAVFLLISSYAQSIFVMIFIAILNTGRR